MIPLLALVATALNLAGGTAAGQDQRAAPSAPTPPPPHRARAVSYVSNTDYPAEAMRRQEQGRVGFELTVSADGRVSACQVTESSGSSSLDRATCEIMRTRARFSPARDDQGNPVADSVHSSMHWVLPD